jgi:hypothetical protein
MVATSDSDSRAPAWFIAGLTMAVLRPFNEEKVKRTEEVRVRFISHMTSSCNVWRVLCPFSHIVQSVFTEVGIAHAYSSFLCSLYTVSLCNSLFKNALPPANVALLDSAYALKLINEVGIT